MIVESARTTLVSWNRVGKRTNIQGAMLSVLDSDKRLADHFGGKVSFPFIMI